MYSQLDSERQEFRVLTVKPGRSDEPLVCSLEVGYLSTKPVLAYETISYHWGGNFSDPPYTAHDGEESVTEHYAQINGNPFIVSLRAEQAIRCMRRQDRDRTLWIDSICINQNDKEEREQQIALMGEIFKEGRSNLIHLGIDEKEEAVNAIDALSIAKQRLAKELENLPEDTRKRWQEHRIVPPGWGKLERPPVLLDDPAPLQNIFRCAWFTRLWVIQETCLASKNICHWGEQSFNLLDLLDVVHISRELDSLVERDDAKQLDPAYSTFQLLRYSIERSRQYRSANIDNVTEAIMDLIHTACFCRVTSEHDRVYGLVGLSSSFPEDPQARELLRADYDKPLQEVYRDATRAILMLSKTDDILAGINHRDESDVVDDTKPSWSYYPDRPNDLSVDTGRATFYARYHAGIPPKTSRLDVPLALCPAEHETDNLRLRGMLIGGVNNLTQPVPCGSLVDDVKALDNHIDEILALTRAHYKSSASSNSPYGHSNPAEDAFATDLKSEALRLREREKANEIIRRRMHRDLGNADIAAFKSAKADTENKAKRKDSRYVANTLEHRLDMTTIEALTGSWWSVQFADDEQVAVQAFHDLRNHMRRHGEIPRDRSEAYNMSVVIACASNLRRFFTTEAGDTGCSKHILEPGDQVAVFVGAKYPYILRPAKNGTYRLVDMAIIPAIMHGEVFEMGLQEQEFRIS